jgi:hypothetical protein
LLARMRAQPGERRIARAHLLVTSGGRCGRL